MIEYSHCSICGGSFIGIGNVCPGCEDALSREPLEIRPVERPTRKNSIDDNGAGRIRISCGNHEMSERRCK